MGPTSKAGGDRDATGSGLAPESRTSYRASFPALLASARHSAIHLEQRDVYTPHNPDFLAWLDGERPDPIVWGDDWIRLVREAAERGVTVRRVRVVSEPVTDYIRWEHWVTPMNLAAGEQVRWLPRRCALDLVIPACDFWVFDDHTVRFNHFAGDGESLGPEDHRDQRLTRFCIDAFEPIWERAIPHEDYKPT